MSWFTPKLEPGEQLVLRHPPVWFVATLLVLIAGIAAAPTATALMHGRIDSWGADTLLPDMAIGGVLMFIAVIFLGRWQVAVTDRRVLLRRGFLGLSIEAIDRAEIKAVYFINSTLFIVGKRRDITAFCLPRFAGPLLKQIDPLYDNLKLRTPGLRKKLEPGERVALRLRRSIPASLAWIAMPAVPLLLMLVLTNYPEAINAWLDLFPGLMAIFALVLFLMVFQLSFDISWFGVFFDHWRIVVTDRRVLLRRGLLGGRHDEIARHEIENCLYDRAGGKILLTGAGRDLAIACSQRQAGRILKALGRDEATG